MADDEHLKVGTRISYDGRLCTVRYIGTLAGSSHDYLGVEWDDPSHGKHNGEHEGIRYFSCLSKAGSPASFVRRKRPRDKRRTFVQALKEKYAPDEVTSGPSDVVRISGKDVEEVGFDKIKRQQANLRGLRVIVLDGMCIVSESAEDDSEAVASEVADFCPSCTRLDLRRNLFETWDEILAIIKRLPALTELHVGGNRFHMNGERVPEDQVETFPNVRGLGLDESLLSCHDIQLIASFFPDLMDLSICRNQLADFSIGHLPSSLRQIQLDGNELSLMSQLDCLTRLPNLEHLGLRNNLISTTISTTPSQPSPSFSKTLSDVDFSSNLVSDWSSINRLASIFPGLTALRLSSNPLYENLKDAEGLKLNADDAFMLTLARLAKLQTLNHSKIDAKGRHNAELYYLSQIGKELAASSGSGQENVRERHPRYQELCAIYGEPTIPRTSLSAIDPTSLAARLVRCHVKLGRSIASPTSEERVAKQTTSGIEIDIPRSFNVYNTTSLICQRFPTVKPMEVHIVWETGEQIVLRSDSDSDTESDSADRVDTGDGNREKQSMLREEILVPHTRRIGTWLEGSKATLRLEKRLVPHKRS